MYKRTKLKQINNGKSKLRKINHSKIQEFNKNDSKYISNGGSNEMNLYNNKYDDDESSSSSGSGSESSEEDFDSDSGHMIGGGKTLDSFMTNLNLLTTTKAENVTRNMTGQLNKTSVDKKNVKIANLLSDLYTLFEHLFTKQNNPTDKLQSVKDTIASIINHASYTSEATNSNTFIDFLAYFNKKKKDSNSSNPQLSNITQYINDQIISLSRGKTKNEEQIALDKFTSKKTLENTAYNTEATKVKSARLNEVKAYKNLDPIKKANEVLEQANIVLEAAKAKQLKATEKSRKADNKASKSNTIDKIEADAAKETALKELEEAKEDERAATLAQQDATTKLNEALALGQAGKELALEVTTVPAEAVVATNNTSIVPLAPVAPSSSVVSTNATGGSVKGGGSVAINAATATTATALAKNSFKVAAKSAPGIGSYKELDPDTTLYKEQTVKNMSGVDKKSISDDIERFVPSRIFQKDEDIAEVLENISTNNLLREIYEDTELDNYFVRIFNYFVHKKFNLAYNGFVQPTSLDIENIIKSITDEQFNKVIFIKSKLYLFNIDKYISTFTNKITLDDVTTSDHILKIQTAYDKFITGMINDDKLKPDGTVIPELKGFQSFYQAFHVKDLAEKTYIDMYSGILLNKKIKDTKLAVGGTRKQLEPPILYDLENRDSKKIIKSGLTEYLEDDVIDDSTGAIKTMKNTKNQDVEAKKYFKHWKKLKNESIPYQQKTLFTIDQKFTPVLTPSMTSKEVRNYLIKCEDLQIFYVNKHILIYELMIKLIDLLKYNKTMCIQINKLTSPNMYINRKDESLDVKLKPLITDINNYNTYDTRSINVANAIFTGKTPLITPIPGLVKPSLLGAATTGLMTIELDTPENQLFDGSKELNYFGNNVYLIDDAATGKQKELEMSNEKDIKELIEYLKTNKTFYIKFGDKLLHFRDYIFKIGELKTIELVNGTTTYSGNIEIDYFKEHIKVELNDFIKDPSLGFGNFNSMKLNIPNLHKYIIKIKKQISDMFARIGDSKTIYYKNKEFNDQLLMTFRKIEDKSTTPTTTNTFFEGINIADPETNTDKLQHIADICLKCTMKTLETKGTFNTVRYYIDSVASFNTLQHIKDIQDDNFASLNSILGKRDNSATSTDKRYNIEVLIQAYKDNIKKGIVDKMPDTMIGTDKTVPLPDGSPIDTRWTDFDTEHNPDHIDQYYKNKLDELDRTDPITDKDHLQQVIYRCYDLQVLYMIKHLEVIYINNIIFYYMDMLAKQVAVLLFILSLYKRYNFDINEIGENNLIDVFTDIGKLIDSQRDVMKADMSGGGNNKPETEQQNNDPLNNDPEEDKGPEGETKVVAKPEGEGLVVTDPVGEGLVVAAPVGEELVVPEQVGEDKPLGEETQSLSDPQVVAPPLSEPPVVANTSNLSKKNNPSSNKGTNSTKKANANSESKILPNISPQEIEKKLKEEYKDTTIQKAEIESLTENISKFDGFADTGIEIKKLTDFTETNLKTLPKILSGLIEKIKDKPHHEIRKQGSGLNHSATSSNSSSAASVHEAVPVHEAGTESIPEAIPVHEAGTESIPEAIPVPEADPVTGTEPEIPSEGASGVTNGGFLHRGGDADDKRILLDNLRKIEGNVAHIILSLEVDRVLDLPNGPIKDEELTKLYYIISQKEIAIRKRIKGSNAFNLYGLTSVLHHAQKDMETYTNVTKKNNASKDSNFVRRRKNIDIFINNLRTELLTVMPGLHEDIFTNISNYKKSKLFEEEANFNLQAYEKGVASGIIDADDIKKKELDDRLKVITEKLRDSSLKTIKTIMKQLPSPINLKLNNNSSKTSRLIQNAINILTDKKAKHIADLLSDNLVLFMTENATDINPFNQLVATIGTTKTQAGGAVAGPDPVALTPPSAVTATVPSLTPDEGSAFLMDFLEKLIKNRISLVTEKEGASKKLQEDAKIAITTDLTKFNTDKTYNDVKGEPYSADPAMSGATYGSAMTQYLSDVTTYNKDTYEKIRRFITDLNNKIKEKNRQIEEEANKQKKFDELHLKLDAFDKELLLTQDIKKENTIFMNIAVQDYTTPKIADIEAFINRINGVIELAKEKKLQEISVDLKAKLLEIQKLNEFLSTDLKKLLDEYLKYLPKNYEDPNTEIIVRKFITDANTQITAKKLSVEDEKKAAIEAAKLLAESQKYIREYDSYILTLPKDFSVDLDKIKTNPSKIEEITATIPPITDFDLQKYIDIITGGHKYIQALQQKYPIALEAEIVNMKKINKTIAQTILYQINKLTKSDLTGQLNYFKYVLPLSSVWNNIKIAATNEVDPVIKDTRIKDTISKYASKGRSDITTDRLLYIFKFLYAISLLVEEPTAIIKILRDFIKDFNTENFTKLKVDKAISSITAGPNKLFYSVLIDPYDGSKLLEQLKFIHENMRIIYETILGAAMVIVRIKPLRSHNTAPTYGDIKTYLTYTPDPFAITQNANGKNEAINMQGMITKFNIREYVKMRNNLQYKPQLIQSAGYLYPEIIKVEKDEGKLTFGDWCAKVEGKNKVYGPFAGIYTPEYNNFDIYKFLFGLYKMYEDSKIPLPQLTTSPDIDPYSQNPVIEYNKAPNIDKGLLFQPTNKPENLLKQKLELGGNAVLFGYGFSGSGKTYALLEGNKMKLTPSLASQKYDPSLLEQFIKDNVAYVTSVDFVDIYPLGIKSKENPEDSSANIRLFYGNESPGKPLAVTNTIYKTNSQYNDKYDSILKTNENKDRLFDEIQSKIEKLEIHRREHLRICATPNNDSSSRSFLQITINLTNNKGDGKKNKIIFFDMPGSENTVRLRTELLGISVLEAFNQTKINYKENEVIDNTNKDDPLQIPNIPLGAQKTVLGVNDFNTYFKIFHTTNNVADKTAYEASYLKNIVVIPPDMFKNDNQNKEIKEKAKNFINITNNVFKDSFLQAKQIIESTFLTCKIDQNKVDEGSRYALTSNLSEELNLFLNGNVEKKLKTIFEQNPDKLLPNIKLLTPSLIKKICIYFIRNVILRKDPDDGSNLYFDLTDLPYTNYIEKNFIPLFESFDYSNFEIVFKDFSIKHKYNVNKANELEQLSASNMHNAVCDITMFDKTTDMSSDDLKKIKLQKKQFNYKANKKHPLIKYIIFIISQLLDKLTTEKLFYSNLLMHIFNYIKFIVNQGEAIVTNLEHLKFFFLSNTFNIDKYNNNIESATNYKEASDKNKKFEFIDKSTNNPLNKSREYIVDTEAAPGITLKEKINIGDMNSYKLLSVLQDLAGATSDLNLLAHTIEDKKKDSQNKKYRYLDLFKLAAGGSSTTANSAEKSLFIMFTNIKIFRDSNDDNINDYESAKTKMQLICGAQKDTLDFAQSISSTTQSEASTPSKAVPTSSAGVPADKLPYRVRAKEDFRNDGTNNNTLIQFSKGEIIMVDPTKPTRDENWLYGSLERDPKLQGQFPIGLVERITAGGYVTSSKKKSTPKKFNMKELTKKRKKQNRITTIKKQLKNKNNNKQTLFARRSKKFQS